MLHSLAGRMRHARIVLFHRFFPKAALMRAVRRTKEHELEMRLLPALCDPRKASIDVGANAGIYAAALVPLSAHVVAIEPHPRLARIVGSLPRDKVTVRRAIATRVSGGLDQLEVDLVGHEEADALARVASGPKRAGTRRFAAPTIALDDLADRAVGFVKIDVEGHELDVLAGSERLIAAQRPVFLVEAEARHRDGAPQDVFAFFERHDYDGFFARRGALHPAGAFDPAMQDEARLLGYAAREEADYVNNFIFLPREPAQDEVRARCNAILARMAS